MEQFDLKDLYAVLGVSKNAKEEEIKKAFRNLSKKYHPDVKETGNKDLFQKIQHAYEVLSDENKRGKYDRGELDANGNVNQNFHGFRDFGGFNMEDLFGFRNPFQQRRAPLNKGSDLRIKVTLTIQEILTGVHKTIKLKRQVKCKDCQGKGGKGEYVGCQDCGGAGFRVMRQTTPMGIIQHQVPCQRCKGEGSNIHSDCKTCSGSGLVSANDTVDFDIPVGAVHGIQLSLSNVGDEAKTNSHGPGINGNLIIEIVEIEHETLKRDNINIVSDVYISFVDAVIGNDSFEIETIDGAAKIKIEPGTESGKLLRLRGKGIPDIEQPNRIGDHLVFINIFVPSKLDEEELKSLSKLKKSKSYQPTKENTKQHRGVFKKIQDYNSVH